jgi:2-methylcitrate dehydratase PrpD
MSTPRPTAPTVDAWKTWALADARSRGLDALTPALEGLATATSRLRATEWQPAPDAGAQKPEDPHDR